MVDPANKVADSSKHGVVIRTARGVTPAYYTPKDPAPSFLAHKWSTAVSLATTLQKTKSFLYSSLLKAKR